MFQKGQSGNPAGPAKGTRHKITMLAAAKGGDPTAMRLCVERLVPLRKGRPVVFDLPPVKTAVDVAGAIGERLEAKIQHREEYAASAAERERRFKPG